MYGDADRCLRLRLKVTKTVVDARWAAHGVLFALLGGLMLLPGQVQGQVFSPGKLSKVHHSLDAKCTRCHAEGSGVVRAQECLACHTELAQGIKTGRGFHGQLKAPQCATCHKEHQGPNHQLIKWTGGQNSFVHSTTGFVLKGQHAKLSCTQCHQPKNQRVAIVSRFSSARKSRTFLGLEPKCGTCHQNPHGKAVSDQCQSCHNETGFKPVTHFADHERGAFPLRGIHRELSCGECHNKQGKWLFKGTPASCGGCHQAPHQGKMGQGAAQPVACKTCHQPTGWDKVTFARSTHNPVVPLTGGHARIPCTKCHGAQANQKPKGSKCITCHPDTHEKKFGGTCAQCHGSQSWTVKQSKIPTGPMTHSQQDSALHANVPLAKLKAVSFHNRTHFPLTGKHIIVPCKKCHRKGQRRGQKSSIKFTRGYASCIDCHRDEHGDQFTTHITVNARNATTCEYCHPRGGLWTTSFTPELHQMSRFPLRGAHRAVACSTCHSRKRAKAQRFTFPDRDCRACHRDPHRGQYRVTPESESMACATCHEETSFKNIIFDHNQTKFPLRDRHAQISCTSCHKPGKRGVTLFRRLSTRCAGCHQDPHQGQFARDGKPTPCDQCHRTSGFSIQSFDHDRLTRFPLRGVHKQKKCGDCHQQVTLQKGIKTTLYRGNGTACTRCHRSRHDHFFTAKGNRPVDTDKARKGARAARLDEPARAALSKLFKNCQHCHEANSWQHIKAKVKGFNHSVVGPTLRGRHRSAPCSGCHTGQRAISQQCSTCHRDPHRGRHGQACSECHSPESWTPSQALAQHRKTRLPLTGWHALTDCASCHPRARDGIYRGTPATCYACHSRNYHDPNTHPNHSQAKFDTRCELCHRPTGWTPTVWISRSQSALTSTHSFPLAGRHARLNCIDCHRDAQRPSRRCVACHQQDQRSARSPNHSAAGFPTACERCHGDASWKPAQVASHRNAFPLLGRHRALQCSDCHRDSTNFRRFECVPCHQQANTAQRHRHTVGFIYASQACKRCHPFGRR